MSHDATNKNLFAQENIMDGPKKLEEVWEYDEEASEVDTEREKYSSNSLRG